MTDLSRLDSGTLAMHSIIGYFDPGSGSLRLQALVGGTAGLFVFARFVWQSAFSVPAKRRSGDQA
jgi:hypothetical protein